jgi:uncharacterized repeat protein (TIGR03803 family)
MKSQKQLAIAEDFGLTSIRRASALIMAFALMLLCVPAAHAQFTVIHNFTGGNDGATPFGGLTLDGAGDIYGTASAGGLDGYGTVFKMTPHNSSYILSTLYSFKNGQDGSTPNSGVTRDSNGLLYGAAFNGGSFGAGTVYKLSPPAPGGINPAWNEATLYSFTGGSDGLGPDMIGGYLRFDQHGSLYGTTLFGGDANASCFLEDNGCGTIFRLIPISGEWLETVVHPFMGSPDGATPFGDVTLDSSGNIYGMTFNGGDSQDEYGHGTLFRLGPSGPGYSESILLNFGQNVFGYNGGLPTGGLVLDNSGYLYGYDGSMAVFRLASNGTGLQTLNEFMATVYGDFIFDGVGNLYGTTVYGGASGQGSVFRLTPVNNYYWSYTSLHDFTGGADGGQPFGTLQLDNNGNLYGTASIGGSGGSCQGGCGVVFKMQL